MWCLCYLNKTILSIQSDVCTQKTLRSMPIQNYTEPDQAKAKSVMYTVHQMCNAKVLLKLNLRYIKCTSWKKKKSVKCIAHLCEVSKIVKKKSVKWPVNRLKPKLLKQTSIKWTTYSEHFAQIDVTEYLTLLLNLIKSFVHSGLKTFLHFSQIKVEWWAMGNKIGAVIILECEPLEPLERNISPRKGRFGKATQWWSESHNVLCRIQVWCLTQKRYQWYWWAVIM